MQAFIVPLHPELATHLSLLLISNKEFAGISAYLERKGKVVGEHAVRKELGGAKGTLFTFEALDPDESTPLYVVLFFPKDQDQLDQWHSEARDYIQERIDELAKQQKEREHGDWHEGDKVAWWCSGRMTESEDAPDWSLEILEGGSVFGPGMMHGDAEQVTDKPRSLKLAYKVETDGEVEATPMANGPVASDILGLQHADSYHLAVLWPDSMGSSENVRAHIYRHNRIYSRRLHFEDGISGWKVSKVSLPQLADVSAENTFLELTAGIFASEIELGTVTSMPPKLIQPFDGISRANSSVIVMAKLTTDGFDIEFDVR